MPLHRPIQAAHLRCCVLGRSLATMCTTTTRSKSWPCLQVSQIAHRQRFAITYFLCTLIILASLKSSSPVIDLTCSLMFAHHGDHLPFLRGDKPTTRPSGNIVLQILHMCVVIIPVTPHPTQWKIYVTHSRPLIPANNFIWYSSGATSTGTFLHICSRVSGSNSPE